ITMRARPADGEFVPAQGEARGWSAFDNHHDVEPDAGRWVEAGRLFFALRVDRRRAPAALVKAKVALQERARREEMGLAVLPSKIRQEIREEVKKELAEEAAPSYSHHPAIWHLQRQEVILLSAADAVSDAFREEFKTTFQRTLTGLRPVRRARVLDLPASCIGALDSVRPASFAGSGDSEAPADEFETNRLLGREFLTWLWHRIDEVGGDFDLAGLDRYGLMVGDVLVLDPDEADETVDSFRRGHPADLPEARLALATGKKVASLRLVLAKDEAEWRFGLAAHTLDATGLRLPRIHEEHPDDRLEGELALLDEWIAVVDRLYRDFLSVRLGPGWRAAAEEIRRWIASSRREAGELVGVGT
ncbi:MAG: hypothetical protein HY720_17220, partial [Planctomycetes bacterium]|nr:hypothetical protein [Planctomycetota bacterium]